MDRFVRQRIVTPRIVQPDSHPMMWLLIVVLLLWAASAWYIFDYGRQQGGHNVRLAEQRETLLQARIDGLEQQRDQLSAELADIKRSGQVDREAADKAQQAIVALQGENSELRKELQFLRGLLSNSKVSAILRLRDYSLQAMPDTSQAYRFRFTLTQLTKVGGTAQGAVTLTVSGVQEGQAKTLTLEQMTAERLKSLPMKFNNFQEFEGVLVLPEGFVPDSLKITAKPKGKVLEPFNAVYDWLVEEGSAAVVPPVTEQGNAE